MATERVQTSQKNLRWSLSRPVNVTPPQISHCCQGKLMDRFLIIIFAQIILKARMIKLILQ